LPGWIIEVGPLNSAMVPVGKVEYVDCGVSVAP
jgi:hypothetical protein